jgi:hypothetical protein
LPTVEQIVAAVAAFHVGRFFDGGASDIGFARSTDGGATWGMPSFLPGLTFNAGAPSPFERRQRGPEP